MEINREVNEARFCTIFPAGINTGSGEIQPASPHSSLVVSESRHKVNKNACGTKLEEQGQG